MIDKILERLEEERKTAYRTHERFVQKVDLGRAFGVEKAISIVQEVAMEYEPCYKDCAECEAYDKVKHNCPKFCKVITETLKEDESGGWIPCSERLPELNTMVMCFTVNETYVIAEYGGPDSHYLDSKDVWFSGQGWYRKDAIIAWQPLPAPYQKGE